MRRVLRHLTFALLLFLASGALLRTTATPSASHAVHAEIRRHVQAGVTEVDQVIAIFGEPALRQARRGPGMSEVLGYSHKRIAPAKRFSLLPRLGSIDAERADTFFEISDGVVTRYWTER